jgi:hypothetical protein
MSWNSKNPRKGGTNKMRGQINLTDVLKEAEKAYNEKRYLDARNLIKERKEDFIQGGMGAVALRRWAWAAYYLGNEGNPQWKKWIIENPLFYEEARDIGIEALGYKFDDAVGVSIYNVLSLATRWTKDEKGEFRRQEAYQCSDRGIERAKASGRPDLISSAQNTRNILLREDKKFAEAKKGGQEVFMLSLLAGDFRTAGHGKQNEGDTIRLEIEETENETKKKELHREAFIAYRIAQEMYALSERVSGEKATAHYESAGRKAEEEAAKM